MTIEYFETALKLQNAIWKKTINAMLEKKKELKFNSREFKKYHSKFRKDELENFYLQKILSKYSRTAKKNMS